MWISCGALRASVTSCFLIRSTSCEDVWAPLHIRPHRLWKSAVLLDQLHQALLDWKVLFFRDQQLTVEQHRDFGARWGELEVHPFLPEGDGGLYVYYMTASRYEALVAGS